MPENELNIILKLLDEASGKLKEAIGGAAKEVEKVNKESEKGAKSIKDNFREAGKELRQFRQALFAVSASVGFIIGTTKEWSKHNRETKEAYDTLGIAIKEIIALIGSIFAPTILALAEAIETSLEGLKGFFKIIHNAWTALFKNISYGIQFWVAFVTAVKNGVPVVDAYRIAVAQATHYSEKMAKDFEKAFEENVVQTERAKIKLQDFNKLLQDLDLLFKTGQITYQEYFNNLLKLQQDTIVQNEIIAGQTQEFTLLLAEVTNTDLLNFEAAIQSKINLFNTYKDLYMQGHADMFAFGNMLVQQFHSNMSSALSSIILGEKKARDAFGEFGKAMVKAIVDYMVQQAVAFAVSQMMQKIIHTTTITIANSLAFAWARPAALASLATLGGNAVPAMAGMNATMATAYALAVPKPMAEGGAGVVSSPTLFLAGETGPEAYAFAPLGKGRITSGTVITINLTAIIKSHTDIVSIAEDLGFAIERELRYARSI